MKALGIRPRTADMKVVAALASVSGARPSATIDPTSEEKVRSRHFWMTPDSRISAVLLPALFDCNPWPMFVYDVESFRFLAVNEAALRAYGYSRDAFLALTVLDIRPAEDRELLAAWNAKRDPARAYRAAGGPWRHVRRDGSICEVWVATLPLLRYDGGQAAVSVIHGLAEDDRRPSRGLAQQEALQVARHVGNVGDVGTFTLDLRERTLQLGGFFVQLCDRAELTLSEARAQIERLWHPLESDEKRRLYRAVARREPYQGEYRMVVDGDLRWFYASIKLVCAADGAETALVGISLDITARKREEKRLRTLAFVDPQTELPNQTSLFDDPAGHPGATSLLLVRCESLVARSSYESQGSKARSAAAIAMVLRTLTPLNGVLFRYSEDVFALLISRAPHQPRAPLSLAKRIIAAFERPLANGDLEFVTTPSIGIGIGDGGCDVAELARRADAALHEAARSDNRLALYSPAIDEAHVRRNTLECNLRHAIAQRRIAVVYQPIVSLSSGRVIGTEALLRWDCPGIGPVSPTEFIPIAEEGGVILTLGEWVLREACAQNRRWQLEGLPPIRVSVNVSARQVQQRGFVRLVRAVCEATGLDFSLLELELTERVMMHRDGLAMRNLAAVRRLGVRVSVDDFGTGYSALSYLATLPLDTLKLDRSFIEPLAHDSFQRHLAASVIDLAHRRGLAVVGEGIETSAELENVRALGCDEAQGYFLSRPVVAAELSEILRREQTAPV